MKQFRCLHDIALDGELVFRRNCVYQCDDEEDIIYGKSGKGYCFSTLPIDVSLYFEEVKDLPSFIQEQENDCIHSPKHYTWLKEKCGIEVLDITRHMDFDLGNAVKYILRAGRKDPKKYVEDLEKAIFYLQDKIKQLKHE